MSVELTVDGRPVRVDDDRCSLLEALRDRVGITSPKDGCSPQGQCGCCTVLVDGSPRVACVTPVGRVRGRSVTTVDGLGDADRWARAFCDTGASQCGFCTPGIIVRLAALPPERLADPASVDRALLAHLCRCTGWQTIRDAAAAMAGDAAQMAGGRVTAIAGTGRDLVAAARRAEIEGGVAQAVGPEVALGRGGFADDLAPAGAGVAARDGDGAWHVADSIAEARTRAGKVQGRRTTAPLSWPLTPPPGNWALTLCTTWLEPAYLEPDASWCAPGGSAASPLGNGGAFGGKLDSPVRAEARRLADEHGRPVRVVWSREDVVRRGPKRPPVAIALAGDGSGVVRVADPGSAGGHRDRIAAGVEAVAPDLAVEFVEVVGPAVTSDVRAAVWAEVAAVRSALRDGPDEVVSPAGARARAEIDPDGTVRVAVRCGQLLDEVVVRSYAIGAAHQALGAVRSEGIAVGADGVPLDLTIRSFGVLRAVDTPSIVVELDDDDSPPVNAGDAVYAAVLAAAWRHAGLPTHWPVARAPSGTQQEGQ